MCSRLSVDDEIGILSSNSNQLMINARIETAIEAEKLEIRESFFFLKEAFKEI